jgi:hypothetical protein
MDEPLTDMAQVSPEWLTRLLQKKGVLHQGKVTAVHKQPLHATISLTSRLARFAVSYSDDAPTSAPSRVFLKVAKPDFDAALSARMWKNEVDFYTTVVGAMSAPATVRCYDAVYAAETGQAHLVIEDLSDTHFQPEWPLPPPKLYCEHVMECMAQLHAWWWEHPRLGEDIGQLPTEEAFKAGIGETERRVHAFVDFLGDRLSVDRRKVYDKVLAALPRLFGHHRRRRLRERKAFTLVHGDATVWNFLYPHDADKEHVRIIDWQAWRIGVGTDDLAYMMALHWYPERRRAMERELLRRYHGELLQQGVAHYGWEECWFDYGVSAISNLLLPALWSGNQLPAALWWSHLERAMLAFDDLACDELLEA